MGYTVIEDTILYEDKDLLVCHKPAGMPVQSRQVGSQDMEHALLGYLARKKEPLYLAVIHRLDQPVEGILVFAKNKKSAAGLNKQMQDGKMDKKKMKWHWWRSICLPDGIIKFVFRPLMQDFHFMEIPSTTRNLSEQRNGCRLRSVRIS